MSYTPDEQTEFNKPPFESADQAVVTAGVFLEIAEGLTEQAQGLTDSSNATSVAKRRHLEYQATRLTMYARNVLRLCPDKIVDTIVLDED